MNAPDAEKTSKHTMRIEPFRDARALEARDLKTREARRAAELEVRSVVRSLVDPTLDPINVSFEHGYRTIYRAIADKKLSAEEVLDTMLSELCDLTEAWHAAAYPTEGGVADADAHAHVAALRAEFRRRVHFLDDVGLFLKQRLGQACSIAEYSDELWAKGVEEREVQRRLAPGGPDFLAAAERFYRMAAR